jgi:hypothetical protein
VGRVLTEGAVISGYENPHSRNLEVDFKWLKHFVPKGPEQSDILQSIDLNP